MSSPDYNYSIFKQIPKCFLKSLVNNFEIVIRQVKLMWLTEVHMQNVKQAIILFL